MTIAHQTLVRAACIAIAAASILVIGVQPIFIGLLTERLGLSLVQAVVNLHRGSIALANRAPGLTVSVQLPVAAPG